VREPGGLRIELNAGGWENYQPDWEATEWHPRQGPTTHWRNVQMPDSMMESMPLSGEAREAMAQTDMFAGS
jgi:catechol 2,3-dioxygenase